MKPRRPPLAPEAAVAKVREIYDELARRPVERDCLRRTECCRFKLTGRTPYLTKGEALTAAKAWRGTGGKRLPATPDGACPFLEQKSGRCVIYDGRPFGCRTHFCAAAGGPYARKEVIDLIHRLEDLDRELGGDGAKSLPVALAESLAEIGG
jgi:Fe-S-cluster containining protein